jgi:hypothetical protein
MYLRIPITFMRTYLSKSIIRQIAVMSVAVLFIFAYTTASAQERSERCDDGVCVESSVEASTESESVCNEYQCADGKCAAGADKCGSGEPTRETSRSETEESAPNDPPESAEPRCEGNQCPKEEADTQRAPVAGGGDCDDADREVTPEVCNDGADAESAAAGGDWNTSRSNKPSSIQDDGGDIDDDEDRIAPAQDYNAARSNKPSSIRDDDGDIDDDEDRIAPAQDYNTSRSNKPSSIRDDGDDQTAPYLWQSLQPVSGVEPEDPDSDDDGVSDAEESSSPSTARRFMQFGDIKGEVRADAETGTLRLSQVAVSARDVRNWTEEDRAAFTALRQTVASNTPEAASLRVTQQLLNDNQIEEIAVNETGSSVRYRASLRLFGFIPVESEIEATAQLGGKVVVDYPWYSFLATKPDTQRIRTTLLDALGSLDLLPRSGE